MLAGEVRLEVVARPRMDGRKEVGSYLHNYSSLMDWHFALGLWKGVRRRWSAIMTLCREDRLILFCGMGRRQASEHPRFSLRSLRRRRRRAARSRLTRAQLGLGFGQRLMR
jgi:hypothetical protein